MAINGVEVIPGATRLIKSLRDMGYEFAPAVADLIDNSIDARASVVRIDVQWDAERSYVVISDNGSGMSPAKLRESMRYGAERDYEDEDLGKFGLGLKTASMSQCTRLTVASRQSKSRADIAAYCWDLDHIEATNRWEILPIQTNALPEEARAHLKETTGTVVLWQCLDRLLGYKHTAGEFARKQLVTMCRELEEHLAMVFHRFLAGEVRGSKLSIYLNGNKVQPWDPFARNEQHTQKLDSVALRVEMGSKRSDVVLEPFVLPHQSKFSSAEANARVAGPNKWNRQQGFYIYRKDRMIQSGGWSNLRTLDEHLKLARVALSFNPKLDEAFKINVPKMRVQLPAAIREDVLKALGPVMRLADQEYRKGGRATPGHLPSPQHPTPKTSSVSKSDVSATPSASANLPSNGKHHGRDDTEQKVINKLFVLVESLATADELPVVRKVMKRVEASLRGNNG